MDTGLDKIRSRPASRDVYAELVALLDTLGPYEVENKKGSVHITNGRAFLGVHPRAGGLLVNIVTRSPLDSPRVRNAEQVSAGRCHNEVVLASIGDVDQELSDWVRHARELTT